MALFYWLLLILLLTLCAAFYLLFWWTPAGIDLIQPVVPITLLAL